MTTVTEIMNFLTGSERIDSLIRMLISHSADFAEDQKNFDAAIDYFKSNLSKDLTPSIDNLVNAIHEQAVSNWLFASFLGFQANIDHFLNPVARTFVEVDPELYLQENVARTLPTYASAQVTIDNFCRRLKPEQIDVFEDIELYISHLETVLPKIAHYIGYMLGNELLPYCIPGYLPDAQLAVQYHTILKELLR